MKHLEANIATTLLKKAYFFSNIGVTTPDVPAQVSEDNMGHYYEVGKIYFFNKMESQFLFPS